MKTKPKYMKDMSIEEDDVWQKVNSTGFTLENCTSLLNLYQKNLSVRDSVLHYLHSGWTPYLSSYPEDYMKTYPWIWAWNNDCGVSVSKKGIIITINEDRLYDTTR